MMGEAGRSWGAACAYALLGGLLCVPAAAQAQATPVAKLWREYETVRRGWRVERAELRHDLDRFRAQRVKRRFGKSRRGR